MGHLHRGNQCIRFGVIILKVGRKALCCRLFGSYSNYPYWRLRVIPALSTIFFMFQFRQQCLKYGAAMYVANHVQFIDYNHSKSTE